jgi:hypothetical protein
MTAMDTGCLSRRCTTRGMASHAGLSPGASSLPVGVVVNQLNCTMRSSIGGCGFRAICLTKVGSLAWAARFCRTIPGMVLAHHYTSLTRGRAGASQAITNYTCPRARQRSSGEAITSSRRRRRRRQRIISSHPHHHRRCTSHLLSFSCFSSVNLNVLIRTYIHTRPATFAHDRSTHALDAS